MADHVFIVLSNPPEGVSWEDFDKWYDTHTRELCELPGWVGAERYSIEFVKSRHGEELSFQHFCRYEVDGPFEDAWLQLRDAVDNGRMTLEEWFPRLNAFGWHGDPIGERITG